jgi:hypothetical protein
VYWRRLATKRSEVADQRAVIVMPSHRDESS